MISESRRSGWSRSSGPSSSSAVEAVLERWELHCTPDRRGDRHRRAARLLRRRDRRRDPRRASSPTSARATRSSRPAPDGARAGRRRADARAARLAEHRSRALDLRAATTSSSARARCAGPGSTRRCCGCGPSLARARGLARRAAAGDASRARPAARSRCSTRRATSPAPAASRSRSPTASTSATRRSPRSAGSSRRRSRASREAAEALGIPVVSGNVSLYNETDGRAIPPTPVVGCVGLVAGRARGPARLAAGRRRVVRSGRAATRSTLSRAVVSGATAPPLSLAHDVSDGGLAVALAEAALWSGSAPTSTARRAADGERRPRRRRLGGVPRRSA